jgi:hypothetical protein
MRIGIVGHRLLPAETAKLVDEALREYLAYHDPHSVIGLSCLADGADQLFARAVLDLGGRLEVIMPAAEYRTGLPVEAHAEFDQLAERAVEVIRLGFERSTSEAHMAAGRVLIDRSDRVVAVWDGQPARGLGGTADMVTYALGKSVSVDIIWPAGSYRG